MLVSSHSPVYKGDPRFPALEERLRKKLETTEINLSKSVLLSASPQGHHVIYPKDHHNGRSEKIFL